MSQLKQAVTLDCSENDKNNIISHSLSSGPTSIKTLICGFAQINKSYRPIIQPAILRYLSSTHNLWYECQQLLEDQIFDPPQPKYEDNSKSDKKSDENIKIEVPDQKPSEPTSEQAASKLPVIENQTWNNIAECPTTPIGQSAVDVICDLYKQLGDDDLYFSICREKAVFPSTQYALEFHSQYLFEKSQTLTEQLVNESVAAIKNPNNSVLTTRGGNPQQDQMLAEIRLWEEIRIKSFKELNQWEC